MWRRARWESLFPTLLIGVCGNPTMICNLVMRPTLIAAGTIAIAASIALFVTAREPTAPGCWSCRMTMLQLAWKNISGNRLRSWIVALCALLVAAFALFATLFLRGAATSLELAADRLGADIVVVPQGAETKMEGALMMGVAGRLLDAGGERRQNWRPSRGWRSVSPQIYLATLKGASCCSLSEMFMVAYDPQSDFTIRPWLEAANSTMGWASVR